MRHNLIIAGASLMAIASIAALASAQDARSPVDIAQCPATQPVDVPPPVPAVQHDQNKKSAPATQPNPPSAPAAADATPIPPAEPAEFPHRLPPVAALETTEQQQQAQAAQSRALTQDNSAFSSASAGFAAWGEPPAYEPNGITIDIPRYSTVSAPAVESAPAGRTASTAVGASPPRVGSKPKGHAGTTTR